MSAGNIEMYIVNTRLIGKPPPPFFYTHFSSRNRTVTHIKLPLLVPSKGLVYLPPFKIPVPQDAGEHSNCQDRPSLAQRAGPQAYTLG